MAEANYSNPEERSVRIRVQTCQEREAEVHRREETEQNRQLPREREKKCKNEYTTIELFISLSGFH